MLALHSLHDGFDTELAGEDSAGLNVPHQKGALIEPLAPHPAGDLTVAFARVAGTAGRNNVVERVAAAVGERLNAISLQAAIG